ncbi:cation diffusion facilitator family transporter [Halanaerobium saccharolyticum]|uniref:Cation diffusion facilitator family transporter n=1 Tax=Halanaerobium saccharolyticum TaxID=43595 RepID=A0A4R7YQK7_9FIRM|nr:cation diffusion facilitator family transporter [Halanaerobium saccharolyticum]RAK05467.1 cation diffusion facilitator family transporter [Halanaerobium saccharolyticum]TDV99802.1 cation diffusion facilitator family transporter [Halanaerobium saccharolyticum]TDX52024.1 cation diffusion facilitator family transporter [Halanaerobium saccharolyticum]
MTKPESTNNQKENKQEEVEEKNDLSSGEKITYYNNSYIERVRTDVSDSKRSRLYIKAIIFAIGGNLLLAVIKGILAWISGSSAVFSDAANSLSDALYSIIMGIGLYVSQRPADESHPQGHSQFEPLVSLFIAAAMASAGIAAVWQSIQSLLGQAEPIALGWTSFVMLIAIVVKYIMYYLVSGIGEKVYSPAIQASARDNLVDIISTTLALIGVWGSHFIHPYLDPIAGLIVALWIFKATWEITWENVGYLIGRGADLELTEKIAEAAFSVSEVADVHRIVAEYVGPQLRVDMHINVDGDIPLSKAHKIGEDVRNAVEELEEVDLVYVHIEPIGHQGK